MVKSKTKDHNQGSYVNFTEEIEEWPINNAKTAAETQNDPELKEVTKHTEQG